ncbi:uncharacterized protein [Spinacia oleracea]|uniref:Uncharacterized protein LOC110778621 n=1 Tax=Spinacia oleracea TaxID=3562 RepID=A0A9R0HY19_SPIOL|nr:uncharacterized protein LOC110778621 [Spinacia oleracea]XP_056697375.1 uncharacterized protein LOC110778621 [Spinacia oleracea]XP_056697376.1 uncharacterized protein LOC110778621 [Spinacia oleracea]
MQCCSSWSGCSDPKCALFWSAVEGCWVLVMVCDTLEDNALMSGSMGDREPWLVASRLRDHILTPKERRDPLLWKMVEDMVESDSRLDRYPKLVKGESKVVWEWQGDGDISRYRASMRTQYPKVEIIEGMFKHVARTNQDHGMIRYSII